MHRIHKVADLSRLDLNLFRVFDAVYRERNLTRAAEALFLSQSAVSHALARLRRQLKDELFVRNAHGVTPTPLAERLAPDVRAALGLFQQAVSRGRSFDPRRDVVRFTVAMIDEIEPALLPQLVERLVQQAPRLEIVSIRLDRNTLKRDLASGRLDLAIDVARPTDPELHHAPLMRNDFCVVSSRHSGLSAGQYLAARHVAVSSRRSGPAVEDLMLGRLGHQREIAMRCQHYESACRIIAQSDLLLTMPRRLAEAINPGLGNRLLPLPIGLPPIESHLYWHRQRDAEPASVWLRQELMALAREYESAGDGSAPASA